MFRVSKFTKSAFRAAAVIAFGLGSLTASASLATSANASSVPTAARTYPLHPMTYVAALTVVTPSQEQANPCKYPTGLIGGEFYCGGYVPNSAWTFFAKYFSVTARQEKNKGICQYPTGLISGKWYCGGYLPSNPS